MPDDPFHLTPLEKFTAIIAEKRPALAAILEWYHSRVLRSALDAQEVANNIEAERDWLYKEAVRRDAEIAEALPRILLAKDVAILEPLKRLDEAERGYDGAITAAIGRYAAAGATLNTSAVNLDDVLRVKRLPLNAFAGRIGRAFSLDDKKLAVWDGVTWFTVITGGAVLGLSLGIGIGSVDPSPSADNAPAAIFSSICGVGLFIIMKLGIERLFGLIGDEAYLQNSRYKVPLLITMAMGAAGIWVAIEQAVQRLGILSANQYSDLLKHHPQGSSLLDFVTTGAAPLLIGFSVVTLAAVTGFMKRRHTAVENFLTDLQEQDYITRDEEQRRRPEIQAALGAYSEVVHLKQQVADAKNRVAEVGAPFDQEIKRLESTRLPSEHQYTEAQIRLKQSAIDDLHHAVTQYHRMLDRAQRWIDSWFSFNVQLSDHRLRIGPGLILLVVAFALLLFAFLRR